jgi:hypothetical protein
MHYVSASGRRVLTVCIAILFITAAAYADDGATLSDSGSWWSWLMSRIGVPGG